MRRIFLGTGPLVLGLATLVWATAPSSAQKGGQAGGNAPARTGSVYYAARVLPVRVLPARVLPAGVLPGRVVPTVWAGAVRSEHYAGPAFTGAYRNPYRDEYFRHFRPGYRPFVLSGAQYYGYDGLPLGYQPVVLNGITYYLYDGVYYQPYIYGGHTVYLVVPVQ